jgi:threonine/homoserine/homoserine lactone efflux protein
VDDPVSTPSAGTPKLDEVLASLITFSLASALIVLLPGPDTLNVVRSLIRHGRREASFCVAGVLSGLSIWVVAAFLGLSALVQASHVGYDILRAVGAAYLILIGVQSLRSKRLGASPGDISRRAGLLGSGYRAGLASDLLNPKVGVFFISFLPGFVPHGYSVGTIFVVETALYFALLLTVADGLITWMQNERSRRRLDRAAGLVLLGFGIRLAIER